MKMVWNKHKENYIDWWYGTKYPQSCHYFCSQVITEFCLLILLVCVMGVEHVGKPWCRFVVREQLLWTWFFSLCLSMGFGNWTQVHWQACLASMYTHGAILAHHLIFFFIFFLLTWYFTRERVVFSTHSARTKEWSLVPNLCHIQKLTSWIIEAGVNIVAFG